MQSTFNFSGCGKTIQSLIHLGWGPAKNFDYIPARSCTDGFEIKLDEFTTGFILLDQSCSFNQFRVMPVNQLVDE